MAVGDQSDMAARIRAVLPAGWFPDVAEAASPVLDGLLAGFAWPWAMFWQLLVYTRNQSRLQTSSGNFIDMAAEDYFGDELPRAGNETDAAYISRIKNEFLTQRNTRSALEYQTGLITNGALIFEPWRASDSSCIGRNSYGETAVRYGSRTAPGTVFVDCPAGTDESAVSKAIIKTKSEGIDAFFAIEGS